MRFEDLGLAEPILRAVASEGYETPTAIQTKSIPAVLDGRDLIAVAQTGTGKTGAFALPLVHRLGAGTINKNRGRRPRVLVLCPTRELAAQIAERFDAYGRHLQLRNTVIFGGVSQSRQVRGLRDGTDVVIATPGRLLDLMGQGEVDLRSIEALVLDEADRMLDMGFINDIRRIARELPKKRQTLLFSATMPDEIRSLANALLHEPAFVQAHAVSSTVDAIEQRVYHVTGKNKATLLERLLRSREMSRTLVFTRTKHRADRVVKALAKAGIRAHAIHGNKSQNARTRALDGFRSGRSPVLVATDIASRGIDVDDVTHVVNFDLPNIPETYVHRIGRTARAGASGVAVSFCAADERAHLTTIERLIRTNLEVRTEQKDLIDDSPTPTEPAKRSRGGGGGGGGRGGRSPRNANGRRGGGGGSSRSRRTGGEPNSGSGGGPRRRRRQRSSAR